MKTRTLDDRRDLVFPGDTESTLQYAIEHWIEIANAAIEDHGFFAVALSGGSTPKKIFQALASPAYASKVNWSQVRLFWSDERSVLPTDPDSNYHMAMVEGKLNTLSIPENQIFRMVAEIDQEVNAKTYETLIQEKLEGHPFDLIMLGMGDDGHTASLFPHTAALHVRNRLVVPNHVPQKETWRMTFTYPLINEASHICLYVLGANKSKILNEVLTSPLNPEHYPSQLIGTSYHKATWIIDEAAAESLLTHFSG